MFFQRLKPWSLPFSAILPLALLFALNARIVHAEDATSSIEEMVQEKASPGSIPAQELSAKVFYQMMLAEIAGQRNRLNLAVSTYLELARSTKDPRVSQRATEVALFAQNSKAALEASRLWAEQDPESERATQTLSGLLVGEGKLVEARPYLEKILSKAGAQVGALFMNVHSLVARQSDKSAVLDLVTALVKPYANVPEAQYALALAAIDANKNDIAKAALQQADKNRPGWEPAALLQAQMLQSGKNPQAVMIFYRGFLEKYPKSQDVRLMYARLLVDQKAFEKAREQFELLLKNGPDNPEISLAVGLLSMELKDWPSAESNMKNVLAYGYKEPDTARYYLGQIREEQQDWNGAIEWYGKVEKGEQFVPARMRIAAMLAKQNRLGEARELLHSLPAETPQQKTLLIQVDAQLLSETKDYQGAYDTLTAGLVKVPDSVELLYDRAMVADKLDKLSLLEADLRKIIALKPDHAHAYNALGYSLADRTSRYSEALELIQKAVALMPDDPFIMDSLGWVQYRLNKLQESEKTLRQAFSRQPDPEIAAHLGEVIWKGGREDEAIKFLKLNLEAHPDNEVLRTAIERYHH
jgi:tetratricopeptide (TPR) repeat protein